MSNHPEPKFKIGDKVRLVHHENHPAYIEAHNEIFTVEKVYKYRNAYDLLVQTKEIINEGWSLNMAYEWRFELVESKQFDGVIDEKFGELYI